ncbi:ketopantoate reductase family protein [Jeotgalibacillus proteolyticus]|uniref:2-dehydropantoate 2-reductase n=1 Tax=Jeotgalibacillus proteolyticus TaxID=2082395 RepID=A0A2S5GGP0_9BACL|nr:2-dehydropantoate 2-reductase [Jeotgalibacillus proteolyticus]PPA72146.1 hypothetical protein C4B60_01850 [Jeotgalibacillus proteolyticus]
MKITVIGAGAIGLLFSARLFSAGHKVQLIARQKDQSERINQAGITVFSEKGEEKMMVPSETGLSCLKESDCAVITVKQHQLESLLSAINSIPVTTPIIFTQNGMGHLELLENLPHEHLFVSTVEHGAEKLSSNEVRHNGIGTWRIASFKGDLSLVFQLNKKDDSLFPVDFHSDYYLLLGKKLIKNILINSLTSLFEVKNGELIRNPYLNKLLHTLYHETLEIFPHMKEIVTVKEVERLCAATASNQSSMRKDLLLKRQTEKEAIIGFALREATKKNITAPLLQFLYDGISAKEFGEGIRH